ncbi:MAG: undecaprenyldiphospho-muramoylpentapeptide beta-N-acetylglucosaminyltransferase [Proteobacteria bacterium]|nr:undecaprenyldiphospho-muramoylpentapeptide beta-N-acetylglucosaminyltransferase [Pseudomonadota bacterium]
MSTSKRLLVAGGGTGGHVLAGVAIADEWMRQHREAGIADAKVVFVGAEQGLEVRLVPKNGYPLETLKIGALNKVGVKTRLLTLFQLPLSFLKALVILIRFRPHAVIGVGGYASGPVVMLARVLAPLLRIHTAIIEQNSVAGFTNRLLGRVVHHVFCAFEGGTRQFNEKKVVMTGNPIRSHLKKLPPSTRDPFTLFVFGGSQGAMGINTLVLESLPFLKEQGIRIIHQAGLKDYERVKAGYERAGFSARIERFIDDMGSCYAEASLVVCRAGASSMTELASVGRAPVFIPLPTAADNHQEVNARLYEKDHAAWVIPQGKLTGKEFADFITGLRDDPSKISEVESRIQKFYRPDSAEVIVKTLRGTA